MTKDEAIAHYEAALKEAFPRGATGDVFHHWNEARKALAQPEQEPVAWRAPNWGHGDDEWVYRDFDDPVLIADGKPSPNNEPLYTTPPHRKPLKDEEIQKCYETTGHYQTLRPQDKFAVFALARAIEAAHGIKE